jgi:hypothetical protein
MDLRAHAHNERHRINSELHAVATQVSAGYEPEDVHEPGRAWVPLHHHDPDRVRRSEAHVKHWKLKMWKRRSTVRRAKAQAFRLAGE